MRMKPITMAEVEMVAHKLARKLLKFDEPIPSFETRFPNVLESCLVVPFATFEKKSLYSGLEQKGAILFYLLIKNHPFANGNKRIAVTTLLYFLYKNQRWLRVDNWEFYQFAKWVAESHPKFKKEVLAAIERFLRSYLIKR